MTKGREMMERRIVNCTQIVGRADRRRSEACGLLAVVAVVVSEGGQGVVPLGVVEAEEGGVNDLVLVDEGGAGGVDQCSYVSVAIISDKGVCGLCAEIANSQ
jgi:hypothetical protein